MTHRSETGHRLPIERHEIRQLKELEDYGFTSGVNVVVLPAEGQHQSPLAGLDKVFASVAGRLPQSSTLIVIGETVDLVLAESALKESLTYQLWIAIRTRTTRLLPGTLPRNHFDAIVYTAYQGSLKHTKTRIAYSYCPACELTTKDYGGKKHTYDPYGTLLSDVWRDIPVDIDADLSEALDRFADLFGIEEYRQMTVLDCRQMDLPHVAFQVEPFSQAENQLPDVFKNHILLGDCLDSFRSIPDNSIDFVFADPPYNLAKKYAGYADDLEIQNYFDWCDMWLGEMVRVLKPGRTLAVLNIPLWSVRHFRFLQSRAVFQSWIVWDALSYPVRLIMPAHYSILTFSKGDPRPLPGVNLDSQYLRHLKDDFCIREKCITRRHKEGVQDTGELTDLWADTHRLKHNSRRVDHPTQLPPKLMYRLISLYTHPEETVLDPFNGSGTTTLTAEQLGRTYLGMELDDKYYRLALSRHVEIGNGVDPFRKEERTLTAKNSPVERVKKQKYTVPKKTLQIEVKRVAEILHHIPNRDEMIRLGSFPIKYYDEYFQSWGEVTAAARNKGMSEKKVGAKVKKPEQTAQQPPLL